MYLKHKISNDLVEVLDIGALINPCEDGFSGRYHAGEEIQEPVNFNKAELMFPSGERLPRCWLDAHYKEER